MLRVVYYAVISGLVGMRERMINVEMDGHEGAWGNERGKENMFLNVKEKRIIMSEIKNAIWFVKCKISFLLYW